MAKSPWMPPQGISKYDKKKHLPSNKTKHGKTWEKQWHSFNGGVNTTEEIEYSTLEVSTKIREEPCIDAFKCTAILGFNIPYENISEEHIRDMYSKACEEFAKQLEEQFQEYTGGAYCGKLFPGHFTSNSDTRYKYYEDELKYNTYLRELVDRHTMNTYIPKKHTYDDKFNRRSF